MKKKHGMSTSFRTMRFFVSFIFLAGLTSCFKAEFPLVGPPDDLAGDTITTSPDIRQNHRKVLFIGIGGCRGDAMRIADAPNVHGLLQHAIYSFDALTKAPTQDGPGWTSLLTGVWGNKHGVHDNTFSGGNFERFPMFYKYLKTFDPALQTTSICSWDMVNNNLVSDADVRINLNMNDVAVKDSAIAHLKYADPDVMFVDFEDVSLAGRQFGFDTTSLPYMQAISKVDGYVGELVKALNERPDIADENWMIILSSNHGGTANGYGGGSYPELNVFTIFYNRNFTPKELTPPEFTLKCPSFQDASQYASLVEAKDPDFLNFDNYNGFTAQLKVKGGPNQTGADAFLTNKDWNSGANPGWVMTVQGQGWALNAGDGTGKRIDVTVSAPPLNDNKWHSIAFTLDKSNNIINLYQDDTLRNSVSAGNLSTWNGRGNVKLNSGDDITGNLSKNWGNSVFSIANIRIWDTVIEKNDMPKFASLCDTIISSDNPYKNNLVGWWKCLDGSGSVLKDYGPHGVNMQLIGAPGWVQQQVDLCNNPLPPAVPTSVDIVPAILNWLKIPIDPGWQLDGLIWIPGSEVR